MHLKCKRVNIYCGRKRGMKGYNIVSESKGLQNRKARFGRNLVHCGSAYWTPVITCYFLLQWWMRPGKGVPANQKVLHTLGVCWPALQGLRKTAPVSHLIAQCGVAKCSTLNLRLHLQALPKGPFPGFCVWGFWFSVTMMSIHWTAGPKWRIRPPVSLRYHITPPSITK